MFSGRHRLGSDEHLIAMGLGNTARSPRLAWPYCQTTSSSTKIKHKGSATLPFSPAWSGCTAS